MQRVQLNRCGKSPDIAPAWRFNKVTGKLIRMVKAGGVDWWRYRLRKRLSPKPVSLALKHGLVIQQHGVPSHAERFKQLLLLLVDKGVEQIEWCNDSLDLDMIEPRWPFLEAKGLKLSGLGDQESATTSLREELGCSWAGAHLPLIKRLARHLQKVIELDGGNKYREGVEERARRHDFRKESSAGVNASSCSVATFMRDLSDLEQSIFELPDLEQSHPENTDSQDSSDDRIRDLN